MESKGIFRCVMHVARLTKWMATYLLIQESLHEVADEVPFCADEHVDQDKTVIKLIDDPCLFDESVLDVINAELF